MMAKRWRVAVIGCGSIAEYYLREIPTWPNAEVVAVCDMDGERAREMAAQFKVDRWFDSLDRMLAECEFEILADVASIPAHYEINLKALRAGKHLYSQKPLTTRVEEAAHLIEEARQRGLKISASPVHMLRSDMQEAARLIREGVIGKVSFVRCSVSHGGPEYFQYRTQDPTWFYRPGAGPVLDMGVHGLHQVTGLLGPAVSVACMSGISEQVRVVRTGTFDGMEIRPEMADNTVMMLDFGQGTFAVIDASFCKKASRAPSLEVWGAKGTITFSREAGKRLELFIDQRETGLRGWMEPSRHWPETRQADGVKDLIAAIEEGREPVLSAAHAMHVIEIMQKAEVAAREGRTLPLTTRF